jgi:hypothetical protein
VAGWTDDLEVFCADIGSVAKGKFAWARRLPASDDEDVHAPGSIDSLATAVACQLARGRPVALGLEMPLFAPVPSDSSLLGKARPCDKNAPSWSSGPGASVLATGLVQAAWILESVRRREPNAAAHFRWDSFAADRTGLLIWEAFVTRGAKGNSDEEDAVIGLEAFCSQLPTPGDADADDTERPFSFAAAAAHWAGWEVERDDFESACVLVRA